MAADPAAAAAASAVAAISAVMDWRSSPDARAAAFAYLESVKSGDIRALASTSFLLVQKDQASEIRLHGFKMLQVNLISVMILSIGIVLIALASSSI